MKDECILLTFKPMKEEGQFKRGLKPNIYERRKKGLLKGEQNTIIPLPSSLFLLPSREAS